MNQSGYSKITVCENCKKIFRCPKCRAVLHPEKSGSFSLRFVLMRLRCFRAASNADTSDSSRLASVQSGSKEGLFPVARVRRIDKHTLEKDPSGSVWSKTVSPIQPISSSSVPSLLNILDDDKYRPVVFIDADSMLAWSDFRTDERFAPVSSGRDYWPGSTGKVFLETFQPENIFLKKLSTNHMNRLNGCFGRPRTPFISAFFQTDFL